MPFINLLHGRNKNLAVLVTLYEAAIQQTNKLAWTCVAQTSLILSFLSLQLALFFLASRVYYFIWVFHYFLIHVPTMITTWNLLFVSRILSNWNSSIGKCRWISRYWTTLNSIKVVQEFITQYIILIKMHLEKFVCSSSQHVT